MLHLQLMSITIPKPINVKLVMLHAQHVLEPQMMIAILVHKDMLTVLVAEKLIVVKLLLVVQGFI